MTEKPPRGTRRRSKVTSSKHAKRAADLSAYLSPATADAERERDEFELLVADALAGSASDVEAIGKVAPQIAAEQETPEEAAVASPRRWRCSGASTTSSSTGGSRPRRARIPILQAKETAFAIERRKEALEARLKRSNEPAIRKRRAMEQLEELEEQHDRAFRILNPIAHGSPFGRAPGEPREPETRMVECRCGRTLPSRERYRYGRCSVCRTAAEAVGVKLQQVY